MAFYRSPSKTPSASPQELSGGTPPTEYENAIASMVEAIVSETVFLYSVKVGQGDEDLLNEANLGILRGNLHAWLHAFIAVYGVDNLLALVGQQGQSKFDEITASRIGQLIISTANGNMDRTQMGQFMTNFFSLSAQDVEESLPVSYNDDGDN